MQCKKILTFFHGMSFLDMNQRSIHQVKPCNLGMLHKNE